MFERGCRNFVFLSRSGADKPEAADVVRRLEKSGANVQIFRADASDEQAVVRIVVDVSAKQPIKGVIHAAMVLQVRIPTPFSSGKFIFNKAYQPTQDGLYQNMTFAVYQAALRPKMQGAIALHKALADTPVDFFLMTSSISAVLGNPGQANYCAGNSYLDFLALHRRKRGLAGCSIALPMIEDVGVVAENSSIANSLSRKIPFGIDEREMLESFEAGIIQGAPSSSSSTNDALHLGDVQLVLGLEPEAMLLAMDGMDISDAFWHKDPRLTSICAALEALTSSTANQNSAGAGASASFMTMLAGFPENEVLHAITTHIVGRAARILGLQTEKFKVKGVSVANHGADSMIGVELQSWLFKEFGAQVSVQVLSNPNTTFAGLARTVAEGVGIL